MCGIAGFVSESSSVNSRAVLERMTSAIRHRGPDDAGYYTSAHAFLGHRRLSIIDLSGGHQPMSNEDGTCWICFNGEIFNHADLRPTLEQAGHRYASHCDTETILHAYEQFGPECLTHFRGMFAFAIWDSRVNTLFAARDRFGIKPFYYFWDGRLFAFASEIKALLEHPAISPTMEKEVLPEYLSFGYVSEERTLFRGIRKLMPGHHLTVRLGGAQPTLRMEPYWDMPLPDGEPSSPHDDSYWIAETRRRLEETVRMRLMSDVPLGMFLSGGLDSSAIAALIKRMVTGPVKTFSVGYEEARYSELGYAAQVARTIGTEHHEVLLSRDEFFHSLPTLIWHEDEPIAWPSSVSLYIVSRLAATQVKVVLTGEGSDELFGGYERYRWNLLNSRALGWYRLLPPGLRRTIREQVASSSLLRASLRRKLSHTFLGRDDTIESLYLENFYGAFTLPEQSSLLSASPGAVFASYRRYWDQAATASLLRRMLYADQKTYLVELLMKQDQMSMATSIESRVPFLDHQFAAFAMMVPDHLKIRGGEQKYVLKKAVEDLLPHDIIYRAKMGFPTPLRQWLGDRQAAPLLDGLVSPDGFLASCLDLSSLTALLHRHRSGMEDATDRIWRLLNLQLWGDLYFTGKKEALLSSMTPTVPARSPRRG
ncbi:MAG TPA: asparagine synthase (glutamine-hydrolyzing) [Bryobacteraceae bacterium]|nr:asparagine synthase (glutamine-hydrolyzing) [Bryobacteraceae bacterium]